MDDSKLRFPPPWDLETKRAERALKGEDGGWRATTQTLNSFVTYATVRDVYNRGGWKVNNWLVENFLRKQSVVILAGEAGTGKTYLAFDLLFSLMLGIPWLGRFKVDQGPVFYVGAEGDNDALLRRLLGLGIGRGVDEGTFWKAIEDCWSWAVPGPDSKVPTHCLNSPEWRYAFLQVLSMSPPEMRPVLFVFDPLMGFVQDVDTDKVTATEVMNWAGELAKLCDACVLFLHHTNKRDDTVRRNKIRGESAWTNYTQVAYVLERTDDPEVVKLYDSKQRDDECLGDSAPKFGILKSFKPVLAPTGLGAGAEPGVLKEVRFSYLDRAHFTEPEPEAQGDPDEVAMPASASRSDVADEDIVAAVLDAVKQNSPATAWGIYQALRERKMGIGHGKKDKLLLDLVQAGKLLQTEGPRKGTVAYVLPDSEG